MYEEAKPLLEAAIEGYVAASRGEFPPANPYAICGMGASSEEADENPKGAAWFFGYWHRSYCRNGEADNKVGIILYHKGWTLHGTSWKNTKTGEVCTAEEAAKRE